MSMEVEVEETDNFPPEIRERLLAHGFRSLKLSFTPAKVSFHFGSSPRAVELVDIHPEEILGAPFILQSLNFETGEIELVMAAGAMKVVGNGGRP